MNFLGFDDVADDDCDAHALAATLALFDDCCGADAFLEPPSGVASWSSPVTTSDTSTSTLNEQHQSTPTSTAPKRRRKRSRMEIVHLRSQVVDLEARLAHLQRLCGAAAAGATKKKRSCVEKEEHVAKETAAAAPASESVWFKKAVAEYKQLERAKQWNIDLLNELEKQKRTRETLEQLFQLKLSAQDLAFLDEVEAQSKPNTVAIESNTSDDEEFMELLVLLENIYARTEQVIAKIALRDTRSVFDMCFNETDPVLGRSFQFIVNTPLQHSYRAVENFLWRQVAANVMYECQSTAHHVVRTPDVNCVQKHFKLKFGEALGNQSVAGVIMARRVSERRRTVFAITGKISFPGSSLVIRQEGHIILSDASCESDAPSPSSASSLMQSQFRIFYEVQNGEQVPRYLAKVRDFVFNFNSATIQSYHKRIQRTLLKAKTSSLSEAQVHDLGLGCIPCKMQASIIEDSHLQQPSLQ